VRGAWQAGRERGLGTQGVTKGRALRASSSALQQLLPRPQPPPTLCKEATPPSRMPKPQVESSQQPQMRPLLPVKRLAALPVPLPIMATVLVLVVVRRAVWQGAEECYLLLLLRFREFRQRGPVRVVSMLHDSSHVHCWARWQPCFKIKLPRRRRQRGSRAAAAAGSTLPAVDFTWKWIRGLIQFINLKSAAAA
jgi:hypothetical protein